MYNTYIIEMDKWAQVELHQVMYVMPMESQKFWDYVKDQWLDKTKMWLLDVKVCHTLDITPMPP